MQQGPDDAPSLSGKLIVDGWYFFALIVISTYTANLAAFLTVKGFSQGIHSLDDLALQTEIVYGTVKDSSVIEFFKNSPIEAHKRIYTFMTNTENALVESAEEGLHRVQNKSDGEYVFMWDQPILDYFASHQPCKTRVVGTSFNSHGFGFGLPQGMPYETNFSLAILRMRQSGFIDGLSEKWFEGGECGNAVDASELTDVEEVGITDMIGVMIILVCAIAGSIGIAIIECIWWITKRKMKRTFHSKVSQ